ncbi:MAG: AAA family ATPase [Chloroflexota bacterium]
MFNVPVVIVNGLPCTGKTTLGRWIAQQFHLPFVYKDGIKELLFNTLGWHDRQWSKRLGPACYELLYYFLAAQLAAGKPCVLEGNFYPEGAAPHFLALKQTYRFEPVQILCVADGAVLVERFKRRSESGERHPGHVDHLNYAELSQTLLKGRLEPLPIGGQLVEVDTTDFEKIDYEALSHTIVAVLAAHRCKVN